jgi:hypothetical protein
MSIPTQEQVDQKAQEIKRNIKTSIYDFLQENYKILQRRRKNTRLEMILIDDCTIDTLKFKSPEHINLNVETLCFYMALDYYNVPENMW